jgi:CheY-like chemotaxis protein
MDVQMPTMDGFETTREIRKHERDYPSRDKLPIIAMTAHAMKGDRERCIAAGMDGYIAKPIRFARVLAEIEKVMSDVGAGLNLPDEVLEETNAMPSTIPDAIPDAIPRSEPQAPLDVASLRERLQDDVQILGDIAQIFLDDAPNQINEIRAAIAANDAGGVERAAHALKGAALALCATPLAETARRLEFQGRSAELADASRNFETLEAEWARLEPELKSLCTEVHAP